MSAHHARVEVVLPCLNEARALPRVLGSLPADMRALVVDNGSEDGSPEVARALGARVVGESQRGYGAACHRGLREAEAPLVAFCDADGTIDLGVLTQMADLVQAGWADLVMGRRVAPPGTWPWHARVANAALSLPMSLAARRQWSASNSNPDSFSGGKWSGWVSRSPACCARGWVATNWKSTE